MAKIMDDAPVRIFRGNCGFTNLGIVYYNIIIGSLGMVQTTFFWFLMHLSRMKGVFYESMAH